MREDQDAEGRAIHDLLSAGKLLVFTLDANAAAGDLDAAAAGCLGGYRRPKQRHRTH